MGEHISDNRRIVKNTLMLYFRMLVSMGIGLWTSRMVLAALGATDYGIYNIVGGIVVLFSFLNNTMAVSTQRFLSFEIGRGDAEKLNRTFNASLLLHVGICLIVLVLAETFGFWFVTHRLNIPVERTGAAMLVYQLSVFSAMLGITQVPYNALLIAREHMKAFAYISILEALFKLAIALAITYAAFDKLKFYAVLVFLCSAGTIAIYRFYCIRHFKESRLRFVADKAIYAEISSFAGWNFIAHLVTVANQQGINVLFNIFGGPLFNAARAIALSVNGHILGFVNNFISASVPQITKLYAAGELHEMRELIYRSSKIALLLLAFLLIPFVFEGDYVLELWLKEPPEHANVFLRLTLIAAFCEMLPGTLVYGILATGKVKKYQMFMNSLFALNFLLSLLLLYLGFRLESTYYVAMTIYVAGLFVRLVLLKRMIGISPRRYFCSVLLRVFAVVAVSVPVPALTVFFFESSFLRCAGLFAGTLFVSALAVLFVGLDREEREKIISLLKSKLALKK